MFLNVNTVEKRILFCDVWSENPLKHVNISEDALSILSGLSSSLGVHLSQSATIN